ncbi:MAG: tRNA (guanosine(46)-N7)-methyltransferase TrmB [Clostridium sp.]|jgi:tRNA (guanine-N7-)-methyltransferase|nr:tRNA (guanosine(46)-N7)-methyltransferase TrmB [Clostridium sp.]
MRLRNVRGSREVVAQNPYVVREPEECRGRWREVFRVGLSAAAAEVPADKCRAFPGADASAEVLLPSFPLYLEIGVGKGKFLCTMAKRQPQACFVGIEKYSSVLIRALRKAEEEELVNVRFLRMEAEEIQKAFGENEVDKIYLNFSDPWPKDRHAKRRLPSREFLERFDRILKEDGRLEFKTDNRTLFEFALAQLKETGWRTEAVTRHLHEDPELGKHNIMTEYEERFSAKGSAICKYIAFR